MADLEISTFTPDDDAAVDAAMQVGAAVAAQDSPWELPQLREQFVGFLRSGWDGEPSTSYLGRVDGVPVARGSMSTSERDNRHLAWLGISVLPEHRRRGYGTALFDHLRREAMAAGRTTLGVDGWDSPRTFGFAATLGFEQKSTAIMRRQHLSEVDHDQVRKLHDEAAEAARDYELIQIMGRLPEELAEPMVELAAAINDAPTDDLDIEPDVFSTERLASYEQATLDRGERLYRLIARHCPTGQLAGHTVVAVESQRPECGHQHDTAVVRAHRGHRLGLLLKSAMVLWLADQEPALETVNTWNAESNDHMIGVNELLGYRVMGREVQFQRAV